MANDELALNPPLVNQPSFDLCYSRVIRVIGVAYYMEFLYAIGNEKDWSLFILRLALGLVFFYHGMPRITSPAHLAKLSGIPRFKIGILCMGIIEVLSGVALLFGIYERLAAFVLLFIIGAAATIRGCQLKPQFSINGITTWEFEILFAAANLIIFLNGGGNITIFRFLGIW